jgi:hypothetical protein
MRKQTIMREPTQEEMDALNAEFSSQMRDNPPGTPGYREAMSWHRIELARLYGRPIELLADPPPPIAGIVPNLIDVPIEYRVATWEALEAGDAQRLLFAATGPENNAADALSLIWRNAGLLLKLGIYETALFEAYTGGNINQRHWSLFRLHQLFHLADRDKMRAAGDPLPGTGPFVLYRGVAGLPRHRRVRGFSWTSSLEKATWFANRFAALAGDPQVYCLEVPERAVLAYSNERQEEEFLVKLHAKLRPERDA